MSASALLRERAWDYARDAEKFYAAGDLDGWALYSAIADELRKVAKEVGA